MMIISKIITISRITVIPAFVGLILVFTGPAFAEYPAAFKVQVTFYDFHENRSNPEFEASGMTLGIPNLGLVQKKLDINRRPVLNPLYFRSNYLVDNVGKWFKEWHEGDSSIYVGPRQINVAKRDSVSEPFIVDEDTLWWDWTYTYDTSYYGGDTLYSDTAFKNIAFTDSLIFTRGNSGTDTLFGLKASNTIGSEFYPIDGKGFEALGFPRSAHRPEHNNSFTMHLSNQFVYRPGQSIRTSGDDDIWVFINDSLVIDLGGVHPAGYIETVNLDECNLTAGQTYNFDFFYCERLGPGADLNVALINFALAQKTDYSQVPGYPVGVRHTITSLSKSKGKKVMLGHGVCVTVPDLTRRVSYTMIDAMGHTVAQEKSAPVEKINSSLSHQLPTGVFFIKAECIDMNGRTISTVISSISIVR